MVKGEKNMKLFEIILDLIVLVVMFINIYSTTGDNQVIMFALFWIYCKILRIKKGR